MINKQAYINSFNQNIDMIKGDTLSFNFILKGLGGNPDSIIFACAEKYGETPIFTASVGDGITLETYDTLTDTATYSVWVDPVKTYNLDAGRYNYDLQITHNDDVFTLMRGSLTLLNDITRGLNDD